LRLIQDPQGGFPSPNLHVSMAASLVVVDRCRSRMKARRLVVCTIKGTHISLCVWLKCGKLMALVEVIRIHDSSASSIAQVDCSSIEPRTTMDAQVICFQIHVRSGISKMGGRFGSWWIGLLTDSKGLLPVQERKIMEARFLFQHCRFEKQ